ncbi:MAG: hypothetical protein ACRENF_01430 [Thermodesulfobacteriota bacterium]
MILLRELIKKKILIFLSFLFFAVTAQQALTKELGKDPNKCEPLIAVFYPKVVVIENSSVVETVITLLNIGNKPISLGRVDYKTGRMVDGDCELRLSVDINTAPLRHMQVGGLVTISNDTPFISTNLINGVTLMSGSMLWMRATALPTENIKVSEEGEAKFTFTLLGSVEGKIKTMIEMGFSVRYEKGKHSDNTRLI